MTKLEQFLAEQSEIIRQRNEKARQDEEGREAEKAEQLRQQFESVRSKLPEVLQQHCRVGTGISNPVCLDIPNHSIIRVDFWGNTLRYDVTWWNGSWNHGSNEHDLPSALERAREEWQHYQAYLADQRQQAEVEVTEDKPAQPKPAPTAEDHLLSAKRNANWANDSSGDCARISLAYSSIVQAEAQLRIAVALERIAAAIGSGYDGVSYLNVGQVE